MNTLLKASALSFALVLLVVLPGCSTDAFCFANCAGSGAGGKGGASVGDGSTSSGGSIFGDTGGTCSGPGCTPGTDGSAGGAQSTCTPTNAGVEICDGKDNDCDGLIDEPGVPPQGIDFSNVHTCGNCATDCTGAQGPLNVVTPACTPPATLDGKTAGTCTYTGCAPNTYSIDGNEANGCEYYCPWNPNGTNKTDLGGPYGCGKDDDCNGKIDDGLNFCSDPQNCGTCGFVCSLANVASATCVSTATGANCNANNTHCVVGQCADGFFDVNGSPDDGCEYPCTKTNGGVEICDGVDNDCNGLIDNEDPGLETSTPPTGTPLIGSACSGGTQGLCLANQGVTKCIDSAERCCDKDSNNVTGTSPRYPTTGIRNDVCVGVAPPHVVTPGQVLETCNGVDDDCDGVVDDNTVDSGGVCGNSVGTCTTGNFQCVGALLVCVGSTGADPSGEICDGKDNDCDGVIDGTAPATKIACATSADCTTPPNVICLPLSNNPNDKGCVAPPHDITDLTTGAPLACGVTPAPPAGVPQPCRPGTKACLGGVALCQGSVGPQQGTDDCGVDSNCDGTLSSQTGLINTDVLNCGACGNNCNTANPSVSWLCQAGVCVPNGCQPGHIECGGTPNDCETACTFTSSTESCDGIDNNCNCKIDESPITPPSPIQACGVSSTSTDPVCTTGVTLACVSGGWQCTFSNPTVCSSGSCAATPDICDGIDNNCNGQADEGFKPPAVTVGFLGQGCFSDDGKAAPGDGPCRTQGQFICTTDGSGTKCSATKDTTKASAEKCDGIDNNCNGLVDDGVATSDSRVGVTCFGGTKGICAAVANAGKTACVSGGIACQGANIVRPGDRIEVCNGLDDDCDGIVDNNLTDTGAICGSSVGQCKSGTMQCAAGKLSCAGSTGPQPEICDGLDNNCNGQIDDAPTDVGTACNTPPAPPTGATQPCKAGVNSCIGGTKVCQGSIVASQATDNCGDDTNCDGKLTNQSGLKNTDVANCGACGNNCAAIDVNSQWSCLAGACVKTGCKTGFIDCDGNPNTCETACTITSSTESCNGKDDNCDCLVDNNIPAVTPIQVCGVSPAATDVGCTSGVATACVKGAWQCTFPAGYCTGGNCSTTTDTCDGKDNNCNGSADEGFKPPLLNVSYLGQACSTPAADGPCQGTGSFVCNAGGTATTCSAVKDTSKSTLEVCDGIDNNCNGTVDEASAVATNDSRVGKQCFGGTLGACAASGHAGSTTCVTGAVVCTGANLLSPGAQPEICNGIDDDCNGLVDDNPTDVGGACGSGVGACQQGKYACVTGAKVCQGAVASKPETCNGIDDDCDGTIDNHLTDTGGNCNVPPAAPAATAQCPVVTETCQKGILACAGGVLQCSGSVTASSSTPDGCCADSNCDGTLTGQPDFQTDIHNCGACGNDCNTANAGKHGIWSCVAGACSRTACAVGFINCDANAGDCERACTFSGTEQCNGVDDDCNCKVDDAIASIPAPSQVCGVSASASDAKCLAGDGTTGVKVACSAGTWACTFPTGYCNQGTPAGCSTTVDGCDGKDNNCNGATDENQKPPVLSTGYLGQACASDDGKPAPGDGQCRGTGVYICNTATTTKCTAVKNTGAATQETCDGVDNDCDGLVDESKSQNATGTFVKPAVIKVTTTPALWMYQYEASRPSATNQIPGQGDGYWCTGAGCTGGVVAAPAGTTLDKTPACSMPGKIPWFNVTPGEVEETCQAMGGFVCTTPNFTTACQAGAACQWGYGTACTSYPPTLTASDLTVYYDTSKSPFCNLGLYDFDGAPGAPNADGLLPTASDNPPVASQYSTGTGPLKNCYANIGNGIYDLTGNLREITKRGTADYPLMGGAYDTQSDDGAQCTFTFYSVAATFKYPDTGFRCCFSTDPTQ